MCGKDRLAEKRGEGEEGERHRRPGNLRKRKSAKQSHVAGRQPAIFARGLLKR